MKKCIDCGKRGIFLKLSYSGRCPSCEDAYQKRLKREAEENARRIEQERILAEQERRRKQLEEEEKKKYPNYPYYSRADGGWYLIYSYSKVSVSTDETAYYHGDVQFSINSDSVDISLNDNIIGNVSNKRIAQMIIDFINRNEKVLACFDSPNTLRIAFYRRLLEQLKDCENIICKITNTSKKDEITDTRRYECLEYMEENDLVKIEYNDDTEKYLLRNDGGDEIGELSKSDSKKVVRKEDDGFEPIGFITDQDYSESGIPTAKVKIFFK